MAVTTSKTNKPILPRGADVRPIDSYNRAELYSGKALDFDGVNDEVNITNIADTYKSFVLLFNSDGAIKSTSPARRMFGFNSSYFGLSTGAATGSLDGETLTFLPDNSSRTATTMNFEANTWYHLAIVWNSLNNNFDIYINGQNETILSHGTTSLSVINNLKIAQTIAGGTPFNGQISNFKAFNTALTATQVADLYNNPEKVVPTGVANTALKLWLPMMEGAGTTAYDGSGNGNHGTIAGATYVNGIGAPVAQSAVMDWNKGSNLFEYSEQFDQSAWTTNATLTSGQSAPDGSLNAYKIVFSNASEYIQNTTHNLNTSTNYTLSCWVKSDGANTDFYIGNLIAGTYETRTATSEWQRFEVTQIPSATTRYPRPVDSIDGTETLYIWGAQLEQSSSAGAYIPNHTTALISTPVLIPQGLTTGRDITGVNLFENVRKQGALNLDGKSWAEVHDNESLDFGTGSFTIECWAKLAYENTGSSYNGVFGLGTALSTSATAYIYTRSAGPRFFINGTSLTIATTLDKGNWHHLVVTRTDAGAIQTYYDGAEGADSGTEASTMTNAYDILIGRDTGESRYYKDQIAQPRIYNRALTASEVKNNYEVTEKVLFDGTRLLDEYSGAAAAYSLRLLDSEYIGAAVKVRRASDNAEQDIYFTGGELDTASLETFTSGTDAFVTTWYDQSGSGNDATQTTASAQPKIVASGSVLLLNSKPAIDPSGSAQLNLSALSLNGDFNIVNVSDFANSAMPYGGGSGQFVYFNTATQVRYRLSGVTFNYTTPTMLDGDQLLMNINRSGSNLNYRHLGSEISTINDVSPVEIFALDRLFTGNSSSYAPMANQEIIIWPNDQSTNRTGIETNINDFYDIY